MQVTAEINNILRVLCAHQYIEREVYDESHSEYEDEEYVEDVTGCLSEQLRIDYLGSGIDRGVLRLGENFVAKIAIQNETSNLREIQLYNYIAANKPFLLPFLLPPIRNVHRVTIAPYAKEMSFTLESVLMQIVTLFKKNGILFTDLDRRADNFGWYKGKPVILDYADWQFIKDVKALKFLEYKGEYIREDSTKSVQD